MAMSEALSNEEVQAAWAKLTEEIRTGVLLTLRNGRPFGSHVPYVFSEHWTRAYIHVSRLALHTEHLLHDPRVGLFEPTLHMRWLPLLGSIRGRIRRP